MSRSRCAPRKAIGFTLLEMLLALSLGALLLAAINTGVVPLLKHTRTEGVDAMSASSDEKLQDLLSELDRLAAGGQLAFPTAIDMGNARSSIAIQLKGTGLDVPSDSNGDGVAGIANMDPAAARSSDPIAELHDEDDDRDGSRNEDEINGVDDDEDGLIDEDPEENMYEVFYGGIQNYDDNNDGHPDKVHFSLVVDTQTYYWNPYLPNSFATDIQVDDGDVDRVANFFGFGLGAYDDDNEDGIQNNNPVITWTARQEGQRLICTTPLVEHDATGDYATVTYQEYTCLEGLTSFKAQRTSGKSGKTGLSLAFTYDLGGLSRTAEHHLVFP